MVEGDAALMRQLREEHAVALWGLCMRLTGQDSAHAEDVVSLCADRDQVRTRRSSRHTRRRCRPAAR